MNQLYLAEIYDGRKHAARDEGGSGFLLGKNLILTAHHVIGFAGAPVPPGETGYDVRAIGDFREGRTEWLKARVCWDDPGRDLALLEVIPPADPATIAAAATTPRFGRLSGQEELPWSATGFPLVRKQGERNEALPVSGGLDPGAAAKKLSVDLAVHSALIPRRAEDWGGMSGAAVFVADCLVGVLVAVSDEYQQTALSLSLIEGVLNDITFRAALAAASGKQPDCWTISGTAGAITATPAIEDPEIDDRIAAIAQEHRGPLFGRRDALIALDSYIASPRERPFVLRAPSGYGKTALLATWERYLQARGAAVVAHYFSDDRGTSSSLRCLRRLKRQLRTARRQIVLGERQPTDVDAAYTELYQTLTEHLSQSGPLVIILDGLDEADSMIPPLFVQRLPDHLWLVIALHGPAYADPSWIAKWTTGATELPLTLLDRSAVQDWLGNAWSQQGRPSQISTASTDEVWTRTEGYPLFLHYLVPLLQTQRDDQGLLAALRQVPPAFHNYVGGELIKLAEVADRLGHLLEVIYLLAVSPGPMPKSLLDRAAGLAPLALFSLPFSLGRWLNRVPIRGEIHFSIAHALVAGQIRAFLGDDVTRGTRSKLIATCWDWQTASCDYPFEYLVDLLADASAYDEAAYSSLLQLGHDTDFRQAQLRRMPHRPDVPLKSLGRSLAAIAPRHDPTTLVEFVFRHILEERKLIEAASPIAIVRAEGDPALRMAHALWLADRLQNGSLWRLLVQAEMRCNQKAACAIGDAVTLPSGPTVSWRAYVAVSLLWALYHDRAEIVASLARQLIPPVTSEGVQLVDERVRQAVTWLVERLVSTRQWDVAETLSSFSAPLQSYVRARRVADAIMHGERVLGVRLAKSYFDRIRAAAALVVGLSKVGQTRRAQRLFAYAKRLLMKQEAPESGEAGIRWLSKIAVDAGLNAEAVILAESLTDHAVRAEWLVQLAARTPACASLVRSAETAVAGLPRPPLALAVVYARTGRKLQASELIDAYRRAGDEHTLIDVVDCLIEIDDLAGACAIAEAMPHRWPLKEITAMICLAEARQADSPLAIDHVADRLAALHLEDEQCAVIAQRALDAAAIADWPQVIALLERALAIDGHVDRSRFSDRPILASLVDGIASQLARTGKLAEARSVRRFAATGNAIAVIAEELVWRGVQDVEATLADDLDEAAAADESPLIREWERFEVEDLLKDRDDAAASSLRSLSQQAGNSQLDLFRKGEAIGLSRQGLHASAVRQAMRIISLKHRDSALRLIGVLAATAGMLDIALTCLELMLKEGFGIADNWVKQEVRTALARWLISSGEMNRAIDLVETAEPDIRVRHYACLGRIVNNREDLELVLRHIATLDPVYRPPALPAIASGLAHLGDVEAGRSTMREAFEWARSVDRDFPVHFGTQEAAQFGKRRDNTIVELLISAERDGANLDPNGEILRYARMACRRPFESRFNDFEFTIELIRRGAMPEATAMLASLEPANCARELASLAEAVGGELAFTVGHAWINGLSERDYLGSPALLLELTLRTGWDQIVPMAARAARDSKSAANFTTALATLRPDAAIALVTNVAGLFNIQAAQS